VKRLLSSAAAIAMLAAFAIPASADSTNQCAPPQAGQTTTCTMHLTNVTFPPMEVTPNVCPDGSIVPGGSLSITVVNGVAHIMVNGAGDEWDTTTLEGTFVFVANDVGPAYTGHFVEWFGDSVNNKNAVANATANFIGKSATGGLISLHIELHFRLSVSGQVTMTFVTHC
jgi:hypothetical protein